MKREIFPSISLIAIILSLVFFILPVLFGNSVLIAFFFVSLALLITSFVFLIISLQEMEKQKEEEREGRNLALTALIISTAFFVFLVIGALINI